MIVLQNRDVDILKDIGTCEVMSYKQISILHFINYNCCKKRMGQIKRDGYVENVHYKGKEKIFILTKEGINILAYYCDREFKLTEIGHLEHRLMRSDLYCKLKGFGITDWTNESYIQEINRSFDASFDYKSRFYLVEIHNAQKSKVLKEKIIDCLKLDIHFTLIVYCINKDTVINLINKMKDKGELPDNRLFGIKVVDERDKVIL